MIALIVIGLIVLGGIVLALMFAATHYDHGKRPW